MAALDHDKNHDVGDYLEESSSIQAACPWYPPTNLSTFKYKDAEELTEKVLQEGKVFITPGFIFGTNGSRYVRISLCAKDEKLKEALERIENMKL